MRLTSSTNSTISDPTGVATIVDDDGGPVMPGPATFIAVNDISVNESSTDSTVEFTLTRSGNATGESKVSVQTTTAGHTRRRPAATSSASTRWPGACCGP